MSDRPTLTERLTDFLDQQESFNRKTKVRLNLLELKQSRWVMFFIIVSGTIIGNIIVGFLP